jgi:VWFA-related protein
MTRRHLLAGLVAPLCRAQDAAFSTDVSVVNTLAIVRDAKGHIIADLDRGDFILEERGRVQQIRYFTRQSELPLILGLLVDISTSQRRVIEAQRKAALGFFERVLRPSTDLAFLIQFSSEVELLSDLTGSREALDMSLGRISQVTTEPSRSRTRAPTLGKGAPRGGTALYDAISLASEELMRNHHGRKALIVLSDGCDTASKLSLGKAIDDALRSDTLIYSIRFADKFAEVPMRWQVGEVPSAEEGREVLQQMSADTGGAQYEVKRSLTDTFDRIEQELRNQYSVGYTPEMPASPGEFRRIRLTCRRIGLTVQARRGYFGANTPQDQTGR